MKSLKFGEGMKIIQGQYPDYVILAKNGIFYNAIGENAILLNQEFELTKICFGKKICKVGIPEQKIEELKKKLREKNYKFIVYYYTKGEYKDSEEQFVEIDRKDEGKKINKVKEVNCDECEYFLKLQKRNEWVNPIIEQKIRVKNTQENDLYQLLQKKQEIEVKLQELTHIVHHMLQEKNE